MADLLDPPVSLRDRVESLRLPSEVDDPRRANTRIAWLPWALCILLALGTLSLAVRVWSGQAGAAPAPSETAAPNSDQRQASTPSQPSAPTPAVAPARWSSSRRVTSSPPIKFKSARLKSADGWSNFSSKRASASRKMTCWRSSTTPVTNRKCWRRRGWSEPPRRGPPNSPRRNKSATCKRPPRICAKRNRKRARPNWITSAT